MTPTTNDLLMRVLRVESPGLFDGSEYEPMEVVEWDHCDYCPAICETCGDEPENLTIKYRTRNGLTDCQLPRRQASRLGRGRGSRDSPIREAIAGAPSIMGG